MKYEYEICYIMACSYFKCNICDALIVLDYPKTYEESEEMYAGLVKQHTHKGESSAQG